MRVIKNELKEMREELIIQELEKMNKDNDSIAIVVDNLNVDVYATTKDKMGVLNLDRQAYKGDTQEQDGLHYSMVIDYRPYNETYKIRLNPYNGWDIEMIG